MFSWGEITGVKMPDRTPFVSAAVFITRARGHPPVAWAELFAPNDRPLVREWVGSVQRPQNASTMTVSVLMLLSLGFDGSNLPLKSAVTSVSATRSAASARRRPPP